MKLGALIVTHNRLFKLKKCLEAYKIQSWQPSVILVIDNASSDGTAEYLDQWSSSDLCTMQKKVIHLNHNLGGAGGFAAGIDLMMKMDLDWIWLADDDAYPERECLEKIFRYVEQDPGSSMQTAALCAKVVNTQGDISVLHRRLLQKNCLGIREIVLKDSDYENETIKIDLFSFVGVALRSSIIRQVGLPREDYFIYFDDTEYSIRIKEYGSIICISEAVVVHDSPEGIIQKNSWKNYYMFRNKLYTYKLYFSTRSFLTEILRTIYMITKYYNSPASWKQFGQALRDVMTNHMGKNADYTP